MNSIKKVVLLFFCMVIFSAYQVQAESKLFSGTDATAEPKNPKTTLNEKQTGKEDKKKEEIQPQQVKKEKNKNESSTLSFNFINYLIYKFETNNIFDFSENDNLKVVDGTLDRLIYQLWSESL